MKLLILGLILIGIILVQIYYVKKNKEGFNKSINNMLMIGESKWENREEVDYSGQANDRRAWKKERKGYWNDRKNAETTETNTIQVNPGTTNWLQFDDSGELVNKNISAGTKMGVLENSIMNCRKIESCDDLQEGGNCGYCALDEEFRQGDDNGPFAHTCKPKYWTKDAETCKKIKLHKECSEAKDCGDLTGDKAEKCGFCPTTGKIVPMEKTGETYHAIYDEDICPDFKSESGDGLLPADKCLSFAKENPCITPDHASGPHNIACLKRLWSNSKCTTDKPYGKSFTDIVNLSDFLKSFNKIGERMSKTFTKTKSADIKVAKTNSINCFGNSDNIDVCDEKYYYKGLPHSECLQKHFLESGCSSESPEYSIIGNDIKAHVIKMNSYKKENEKYTLDNVIYKGNGSHITTIDDYKKDIQRVYNLTSSAVNEETRKETSDLCFGKEPPPSNGVKPGDTVTLGPLPVEEGTLQFEGVVTGKRFGKFKVMWTKTRENGVVRQREGMSEYDQAKFFGWDGIKPTFNTKIEESFLAGRLNVISRCSSTKSACKITCRDKIFNVKSKYPRPRDCEESGWSNYSTCNKNCGGGTQYKTRTILYPARFGGKSCSSLKSERKCNTHQCPDPNFVKF